MTLIEVYSDIFCVINLVFRTSKGHERNPEMHAASIPPIDALNTEFNPNLFSKNFRLN